MRDAGPDAEPTPPLPYLVAINLTQRCNLACEHCYMDARQRGVAQEGELTTAETQELLDEIGGRAPGTIIVLTGGEPLMRPDLESLVAAGGRAGLRMVVGTNGLLLTEPRIRQLKGAGLEGVGISLDSVRADLHDGFRGLPGAFEKTCRAFRLCGQQNLHAQLHCTVTRANLSELEAMVALGRELGATIVNFFFLVCVGRGQATIDLEPDRYEEALREIAHLQRRSKGIMVQTRCTPHFKRILYEADPASPYTRATGYDGGGCLAATRYCRVDPLGEVTPCPYMELSAGNVRDRSFWRIWDEAPLFHSLREPVLEGRCGECEFELLCGGCRARSLVEAGNLLGEDPNCAYRPCGGPTIAVRDTAAAFAVPWTDEARDRLKRVPIFLRGRIERKLEERATRDGVFVTVELMKQHREERERELGIRFE